ncbi:hypothetical protein EDD17DRAFT_1634439 [Pisolithus thermaeus]|nr:hypothetical protein EDD17DRAFT_1634439 [Pisolithus thermaeus]
MQTLVEPVVLPPYRGEELGSTRFLQPGTAVGLRQDWMSYPDDPSNSTLAQLSEPLQLPPHVPSEASAHGELAAGSSTSAWPPEPSDPYPMANVAAFRAQAHPQGYHPSHDRYDQHGHCPPTSAASSTVSYNDYPFAAANTYHYQSRPQHHPIHPLPRQHQPTHSDSPQYQPVSLAPSELAQHGPVAQESGLDQHWISSTQFGSPMGNGYKG